MKQIDTHGLKVNGWSKIFWALTEKKKAGVVIMISCKAKAKLDLVKRDKEGNYILIRVSLDNEEISVLNMYAPNSIASTFLKEKLAEVKEIDSKLY